MMLDIYKILDIGIAFSTQQDLGMLLETIIDEAMSITNADGGTLYMLENDKLEFKILRNKTMKTYQGGYGAEIDLPPVPLTEENVCSYVAIHRKLQNVKDVYDSTEFDFSGPRKYDSITGYKTKSMLVMPLEDNRNRIVGVLQLINATDENGTVVEFDEEYEYVFRSFASQAAIAVTNMRYTREIEDSFYSFIEVMSTAVDERTPYNAKHTTNVTRLTAAFIEYINELKAQGKCDISINDNDKEQLVVASWLHDIGKIVTPIEVMNKATRLGERVTTVLGRFEIIRLNNIVAHDQNMMTTERFEIENGKITEAIELIKRLDTAAFISDDDIKRVVEFSKNECVDIFGQRKNWLSEEEVDCLSIRYGTLTKREREIMENHVVITKKLLDKIKFTSNFKDVPIIASEHHERLNGGGYPYGLNGDNISISVRILGIMDVFEALTANDRPYKKAKSYDEALVIMQQMVQGGEIDGELVSLLGESRIWEKIQQ